MGGGHRTLVAEGGPMLVTEAVYHGPSILITRMSGLYDSYIFIAHTPVDDGSSYVWHALLVRSATGQKARSEEHTSELQSLMRISYAVFCLKKKTYIHNIYSLVTRFISR